MGVSRYYKFPPSVLGSVVGKDILEQVELAQEYLWQLTLVELQGPVQAQHPIMSQFRDDKEGSKFNLRCQPRINAPGITPPLDLQML